MSTGLPHESYGAGTRVEFTSTGRLGLVLHGDALRFEPEFVEPGDEGSYVGPHPNLDDEWHLVAVMVDGRRLLCPCHVSQFRAVE